MILGDFQFNLKTLNPNAMTRTTEYNWGNSERVGDLPNLQNLGPDRDQIEIEGVFYPNFYCNTLTALNTITTDNSTINGLIRLLAKGDGNYTSVDDIRNSTLCTTANTLISDDGRILGRYVISLIKETQSYFDSNGKPRKIEFTLTLKRSPEESAVSALIKDSVKSLADVATNIARSFLKW